MRKKLLFVTALIFALSVSAQILESDNYNSYTVGNVSSAINAPGQGDMYFVNGTASDYQIVAGDTAHGNYLQVIGGSDGTSASYRTLAKNGLGAAWTARTAGNNIIKGTFDVNTGTATNQHYSGITLINADGNSVIGAAYNSQSRTMTSNLRLRNTSTSAQGNYYISFTPLATVFPANTWVSVGFSYNKTTGEATLKVGDTVYPIIIQGYTVVSGLDPNWWVTRDGQVGTSNTGPTTFGIDNYRIEASDNATLGTSEVKSIKSTMIAIGPNPTTDYLNILTDLKINKAEVFDMSGRKVNVRLDGNKIDVKNLNAGNYIINVETEEGKTTTKFIKK